MMRLLRKHQDWVLAAAGVVLAALTILFMAWSISGLSEDLAVSANGKQNIGPGTSFNLDKARSLDFKGLAQ